MKLALVFSTTLTLLGFPGLALPAPAAAQGKPNIVVILADDIGYGDLACYGNTKVKTPNVDRLAREGLRFTDAYAPSAVCTPTRYALLSGEYAWRNPLGAHILSGNAQLSIRPGTTTLPSVLHAAGYTAGVVGKWHVGLGTNSQSGPDWNGEIKPGPLEIGFDYAFIIPATGDRVPCVFVENHRVVGLDPKDPMRVSYGRRIGNEPTGAEPQGQPVKLPSRGPGHNESLVNGIPRIGFMTGGQAARWVDEKFPETLTGKAVAFLERAAREKDKPFFLYFATHDIHAPRVANARFKGSSQCGIRGDVVQQFDWQAGEVLRALDRLGLAQNTLVWLSSDNGGTMQNGYEDGGDRDLNGVAINGPLRGFKGSIYEGGTREPFLVRWPGHIAPGGVCHQLACLVDLTATAAALTGQQLPADAARDSFNLLPLFESQGATGVRDHVVIHNGGAGLAIRQDGWKYIPGRPGAGKKKSVPKVSAHDSEAADQAEDLSRELLYNLAEDLGETRNRAAEYPALVDQLRARLAQARETGTRPQK